MDRAGAAGSNPASVFGSGEVQQIAQHPKQGHLRIGTKSALSSVDSENEVRHDEGVNECDERRRKMLARPPARQGAGLQEGVTLQAEGAATRHEFTVSAAHCRP